MDEPAEDGASRPCAGRGLPPFPIVLDPILIVAAAVAGLVAAGWTAARLRARGNALGTVGGLLTIGLIAGVIGSAPIAIAGAAPLADPSSAPLPSWSPQALTSGPGYTGIRRLRIPVFPASLRVQAAHVARLPRTGEIGSVVIPATTSHFTARPAIVYLPPAARVPHPQALPVIVAFSGQSRGAGPADVARSGHLQQLMDDIARRHHGVAPIVVVPDQLGPASGNPMCVDSARFGRVATYLMHDVRTWILGHLPVRRDRTAWTVAGFSEGGTCAIQFAAAHPDVFGSLVDVSGEEAPTNGTLAHTIDVGFGGSATAYRDATPTWILEHHRYAGEVAFFDVGARDRTYGPVAVRMARIARRAGMATRVTTVPGLGHNWRTAEAGFTWAFDRLVGRWRL